VANEEKLGLGGRNMERNRHYQEKEQALGKIDAHKDAGRDP
jgi:hypothetical protein